MQIICHGCGTIDCNYSSGSHSLEKMGSIGSSPITFRSFNSIRYKRITVQSKFSLKIHSPAYSVYLEIETNIKWFSSVTNFQPKLQKKKNCNNQQHKTQLPDQIKNTSL